MKETDFTLYHENLEQFHYLFFQYEYEGRLSRGRLY